MAGQAKATKDGFVGSEKDGFAGPVRATDQTRSVTKDGFAGYAA